MRSARYREGRCIADPDNSYDNLLCAINDENGVPCRNCVYWKPEQKELTVDDIPF
jgi:hypothetical protein